MNLQGYSYLWKKANFTGRKHLKNKHILLSSLGCKNHFQIQRTLGILFNLFIVTIL